MMMVVMVVEREKWGARKDIVRKMNYIWLIDY